MKLLVVLGMYICIIESVSVKTDSKSKSSSQTSNSISPGSQKTETYYATPAPQQQPELVPVQIVPAKQMYVAPQPQSILIIAQPALVPQHLLYGGQGGGITQQQLLNYFHSNPQAKYQFLYGGYQPQTNPHPQYVPHSASTVAQYQYVPSPTYSSPLLAAAPSHLSYSQVVPSQLSYSSPYHLPTQPSHFAQQYVNPAPIRSVPAIVTGLEHFTPEQQAQIKAQLSAQLGSFNTAGSAQQPVQNSIGASEYDKQQQPQSGAVYTPSYRSQYTKG